MDKLIERIEKLKLQIQDLILDKYFKDLKENGYVIIPNILSTEEIDLARKMFFDWKNQIEDLDKFHNMIDPHGIFKFHEVGHQEFAWFIRTRPKIINLFKKLWDTNDLVVSFDGSCYIPKDCKKTDKLWTHTDQAPNSTGLKCYQSLVDLHFCN